MEAPLIQLEEVIDRLKRGRPVYGLVGVDILREVILVEAVLQCDNRAAELFLAEFRPTIEKTLLRLGGKLPATRPTISSTMLLVPCDSNPPRLYNFHGKLPPNTWLRTVIRRLWIESKPQKTPNSREDGKGKLVALHETVQTNPDTLPEEVGRI